MTETRLFLVLTIYLSVTCASDRKELYQTSYCPVIPSSHSLFSRPQVGLVVLYRTSRDRNIALLSSGILETRAIPYLIAHSETEPKVSL